MKADRYVPYIEGALTLIESEQMREYLRKCFAQNSIRMPGHVCADIVSYAPASFERKIPVLDLIAAQTESDREYSCREPAKLAREHRAAFKHNAFHGRNENSHNSALYRVRLWEDELPEKELFLTKRRRDTWTFTVSSTPAISRSIAER